MADEVVVGRGTAGRRARRRRVDRDEGIRPETTPETLAGLRPAFRADGTITAGNASQISDGACAVVVMSAERARGARRDAARRDRCLRDVLRPLSRRCTRSPRSPSNERSRRSGLAASDLGLVEINEAFAAVPIHSARMLGVDDDIVNVNGGAVALGHPIGASGARIVLTLVMEMRRRGVDLGGAAICGGGGQGDALVLRKM